MDPSKPVAPPLAAATLHITVCYALPHQQLLLACELPAGATLADAIEASGVRAHYPELDLAHCKAGVFGKLQAPDALLHDGDRVELYRPLTVDPKVARQRRVEKIRLAGSTEGRKWQPRESR